MRALLAAALLTCAVLAGCASDPPAADAPSDILPDGESGTAALDATSRVPAPRWQVGQFWEWETRFGDEVADETFCSIVVGTSGGYQLATERDWAAKEEAAFGHPLLGVVRSGLEMAGWGGDVDLLDFPLTDGKQWTATMPNIAWDVLQSETVDIAMSAEFREELEGFYIMGHVEQGMLIEATFLPATGWFGELTFFDIDDGPDVVEVGFRTVSTGANYTGSYHVFEATPLLVLEDANGFTGPPPEGEPMLQPQPYGSFTVGSDATRLYGVVLAFAAVGARSVVLLPPGNGPPRHMYTIGDLEGSVAEMWIDEPAIPGQWHLATTGAGGASAAYAELYSLTGGELQLA